MLDRWDTTCCRAGGAAPGRHLPGTTRRAQGACSLGERRIAGPGWTPVGLRRALSGRHCVSDRWKNAGSAYAVGPTATLRSQDRVSCQGRKGRQSKPEGGQWASQRAAHPGTGTERPDLNRQARGTDLLGTGEPGRSVAGLGSLPGARPTPPGEPGDRRWRPPPDGGGHGAWRVPGHPCTTPRAPNRFHLVRALTSFRTPAGRAGQPLLSLQTPARFYTLVQDAFHAARLIFACTASCDIFSDQLLRFFLAGTVPLLLIEFCIKIRGRVFWVQILLAVSIRSLPVVT